MGILNKPYFKTWRECNEEELKQAVKDFKIITKCTTKDEYIEALKDRECKVKVGFADLELWQLRAVATLKKVTVAGDKKEDYLKALKDSKFDEGDYEIYKKPAENNAANDEASSKTKKKDEDKDEASSETRKRTRDDEDDASPRNSKRARGGDGNAHEQEIPRPSGDSAPEAPEAPASEAAGDRIISGHVLGGFILLGLYEFKKVFLAIPKEKGINVQEKKVTDLISGSTHVPRGTEEDLLDSDGKPKLRSDFDRVASFEIPWGKGLRRYWYGNFPGKEAKLFAKSSLPWTVEDKDFQQSGEEQWQYLSDEQKFSRGKDEKGKERFLQIEALLKAEKTRNSNNQLRDEAAL